MKRPSSPSIDARPSTRSTPRSLFRAGLRDPLTHFLTTGLVIYAGSVLFADKAGIDRVMRLDDSAYASLVDVFASQKGRAPSVAEMSDLADRWVLNETLYREASALGLDEGDDMIRERIMQKMRVLLQSSVIVPEPGDGELRAYFEANRAAYETPDRLSLSIARIDGPEQEARDWAQKLQNGELGSNTPRIYPLEDRPKEGLVDVLGADFVERTESLSVGWWDVADTADGWQAVRVDSVTEGVSATYDAVAKNVRADWEQEAHRNGSNKAMEALIASYDVEVEPYDPAEFAERARAAARRDGE